MRNVLMPLFLAGATVTAFCAPAPVAAAARVSCDSAYCATLPGPEDRIALLTYLADHKSASPEACEVLSGARRTGCAVFQGMMADARRAKAYSVLAKGWDHASRAAFARLIVTEEAFARAVGENETDHMSAESGADAIAAQQSEKDAFLNTLTSYVRRTARPSFVGLTSVDFSSADDALNATYEQVMAVRETSNLAWGSIDKHGIKQTQRAWLAYRDAFVTFVATLDPAATDAVRTELTARRTVSLEGFLED